MSSAIRGATLDDDAPCRNANERELEEGAKAATEVRERMRERAAADAFIVGLYVVFVRKEEGGVSRVYDAMVKGESDV